MYARTVTVDLNPEMWEEALEFGDSVKERVGEFPGLMFWALVANRETGQGTSFAVFEDEEAFLSVNDQINQILSELGRFFVSAPSERLGEVLAQVGS